jgi:hypothetical protein
VSNGPPCLSSVPTCGSLLSAPGPIPSYGVGLGRSAPESAPYSPVPTITPLILAVPVDSDSDQCLRIELTLAASGWCSGCPTNQKIELAELIACALERGILIEEIANLTGLDTAAVEELRQSWP